MRLNTTLEHRILLPGRPAGTRHPAILLLHGRGADEEDLVGLARSLDERLLILTVRAPFPLEYGGYTWYDAGEIGNPDGVKFPESCRLLNEFIDEALAGCPIDPRNLFLFGFSMGAAMSYAASLTRPELFRGVAACSGYVPGGTALQYRWRELEETEFFIAHGTLDPVVPVQLARQARVLFDSSNARFEYREYPMAHEISDESLTDIAAWLAKRIM